MAKQPPTYRETKALILRTNAKRDSALAIARALAQAKRFGLFDDPLPYSLREQRRALFNLQSEIKHAGRQ